MTISLRAGGDGTSGAIQINGEDRLVIDNRGISVGGAYFQGSNRLINGDMRISQRAASNAISAGAAGAYTLDRWFASAVGGTISVVREGQVGSYRLRVDGATGVSASVVLQRIESAMIADLAGKTVTLSATLRSTNLTSLSLRAGVPGAVDNHNSVTYFANTSVAITPTAAMYTWTFTLPSTATNGLDVGFVTGAFTTGSLYISDVQLEEGTVATAFERRPLPQELALCQRYYSKSYDLDVVPGSITTNGCFSRSPDTSNITYLHLGTIRFPVTMRVTPTVTIYNPATGAAGQLRNFNDGTNRNYAIPQIGSNQFTIYVDNQATLVGHIVGGHYVATADI